MEKTYVKSIVFKPNLEDMGEIMEILDVKVYKLGNIEIVRISDNIYYPKPKAGEYEKIGKYTGASVVRVVIYRKIRS